MKAPTASSASSPSRSARARASRRSSTSVARPRRPYVSRANGTTRQGARPSGYGATFAPSASRSTAPSAAAARAMRA
eukprot:1953187-Lingulodinium_polyedra.AAC.1